MDFPFIKVLKNLDYINYLSLVKHSDVLIGNSSSGIIEAPTLKTSFVNIGNRQKDRETSSNIVHVGDVNKESVIRAINEALSDSFKEQVSKCINPYDNGDTSAILLDVIKNEVNNQ